ncbi:MAG: hypothetical protein U0R52_11965 [Solirubrobacterales bacterium]
MTRAVTHSPLTGRNARVGEPADQRRSTWEKLEEAIDERDAEAAAEIAAFAQDSECSFIFELLTGWAAELRRLLAERGVPDSEIAERDRRLAGLLSFPGGEPFVPAKGWARLELSVRAITEAVEREDWTLAARSVGPACEAWRVLHDRTVDLSYGWMSAWVEHFGEESVPEMFRLIGQDHFEEFFELGDPCRHTWESGGAEAVLLDTLEAMRAHLSTVGRDGAPLAMVEHDDRWEFEFDPCGSGGRALRGDIVEATPSRTRDPYGFAVIEGAYPWTDGRARMCVYCNHCQQLYEQWTIDRSGVPFLVVDPPTAADGIGHENPKQCRYTIYKRLDSIPDEVFERCGRTRGEARKPERA